MSQKQYDEYAVIESRFPKSEYEWLPVRTDEQVTQQVSRRAYRSKDGIVPHEVRWFGPGNGVLLIRKADTVSNYNSIGDVPVKKKGIGCFTKLFFFVLFLAALAITWFVLYGHY